MAKPNDKIRQAIKDGRETLVPLSVRRSCKPHQLAVWLAVSFLLETHPRADFGLREIADEAGFESSSKVGQRITELIALGLLIQQKPEQKQPGSRNNFPLIRSKYEIPWDHILEESLQMAKTYVYHHVRGGNRLTPSSASVPAEQQSFFNAHDPLWDHEVISQTITAHDPTGDHDGLPHDPTGDHDHDPLWDHHGRDGIGKDSLEGKGASPAKKKRPSAGRPPTIPPPPPAELYAQHPGWAIGGPLPSHPRDLWRSACPTAAPAHDELLAALAAEHDASTDGHGWYWVGRAILAGITAQDSIGHTNYLRSTLIRWRAEDSYGSDKARPAKEAPNGSRPQPVGSRGRRAAIPTAQPAPHLSAGLPADDLSDAELQRIEDEAGEQFRRYLASKP
jgi:hypothetical protein